MRGILLLVCGLCLALAGLPNIAHAQPPLPAAAPSAPASPQVANPGIARMFQTHDSFGVDCITCHDEKPAAKTVPTIICQACHGSYDDVSRTTDDRGENNPHGAHVGQLECGICHNVHKASVNYCATCHASELEVP